MLVIFETSAIYLGVPLVLIVFPLLHVLRTTSNFCLLTQLGDLILSEYIFIWSENLPLKIDIFPGVYA